MRQARHVRRRRRLDLFVERITLPRAMAAIVGAATALTLAAAAVERAVEPEKFTSFGEAAWWAVQTVSTVGYGDNVPETAAGRIVAAIVMLIGIALVPTLTSVVVAILLNRQRPRSQDEEGERPEGDRETVE